VYWNLAKIIRIVSDEIRGDRLPVNLCTEQQLTYADKRQRGQMSPCCSLGETGRTIIFDTCMCPFVKLLILVYFSMFMIANINNSGLLLTIKEL